MVYDLLIKNGMVVDGTGAPARQADVAITGGTIALPPDSLGTLATEATSAAAQQINRIAAG